VGKNNKCKKGYIVLYVFLALSVCVLMEMQLMKYYIHVKEVYILDNKKVTFSYIK